MKLIITIIGLLYYIEIAYGQPTNKRVLCYYDSSSSLRKGYARLTEVDLKKALPYCTHLMYGYGAINPKTFKLSDIKLTLNLKSLKEKFPKLQIYLTLGGDRDNDKLDTMKYMQFLEAGDAKQQRFIDSSTKFLKTYNFDGLDLAFKFPRKQQSTVQAGIDVVFKKLKKMISSDANAEKHKVLYTKFVSNLKKSYIKSNISLAMTVLPNTDSALYFDIKKIQDNFEFINLFAFDFLTPVSNPKQADYTSPIFAKPGGNRLPYNNIDYQVNYWIGEDCPVYKLNLGIATYGRAWKLTTASGLSGIPIIENTNGPAEKGSQSKIPGLLSYSEICLKLSLIRSLRKITDKTHQYGNYAFDANKSGGIWISYDDPQFAAIKAEYVYCKGMGGIAVYDLGYDDFRNHCKQDNFPILKAVSKRLKNLKQCPRLANQPIKSMKEIWKPINYY